LTQPSSIISKSLFVSPTTFESSSTNLYQLLLSTLFGSHPKQSHLFFWVIPDADMK